MPAPRRKSLAPGEIFARHTAASAKETQQLGARLVQQLKPGDCVALAGDLGAGKTQFVRGLAVGLGIAPSAVSSPTYVLLHIYHGRLPLFHLDAYRATGSEDFEAIGFEELLEQGGIVAVEWPQRVAALLPARRIQVQIQAVSPTSREITISRLPSDDTASR